MDEAGGTGIPLGFSAHPERGAVLGEIHARPFEAISPPRRILRFAFVTDQSQMAADRKVMTAFCAERGLPVPVADAKHHRILVGDAVLRWEQHSEFTTYTWSMPASDRVPFERPAAIVAAPMALMPQPGPHLVSIDLHLTAQGVASDIGKIFDPSSLAAILVEDGAALAATDFRVTADGFVRILVEDRSLTPLALGSLVQRLLEVETYRTFALLGLPEAQRLAPSVKRVEDQLAAITQAMAESEGLAANNKLLDEMTALAATLEADAASSSYRFGASRAYDGIVQQRLAVIGGLPFDHWPTIAAFLARRLNPAMRTCQMLEERQANLSRKLTRAANLLRTRVDVEIERQNRDLLAAMNERTRLQLRLQQTVEGLSIAAISYYVVGLLGYLFKAAKDSVGFPLDPVVAQGLSVPIVVLILAWVLVRVRRQHAEPDGQSSR